MRNLLFYLFFLTTTIVFAQDKVSVSLSSTCYKKGYLEYTLTFENNSTDTLIFIANVLNSADESPYDDSLNINIYRGGAHIFSLTDEKGDPINWVGLPAHSYNCKRKKRFFSDFYLNRGEQKSFTLVLCLKKYERIIKSAPVVGISFAIIQDINQGGNRQIFKGIIKTNRSDISHN